MKKKTAVSVSWTTSWKQAVGYTQILYPQQNDDVPERLTNHLQPLLFPFMYFGVSVILKCWSAVSFLFRLFFRRHYPNNTVTFCDIDPQDRKWVQTHENDDLMNHQWLAVEAELLRSFNILCIKIRRMSKVLLLKLSFYCFIHIKDVVDCVSPVFHSQTQETYQPVHFTHINTHYLLMFTGGTSLREAQPSK